MAEISAEEAGGVVEYRRDDAQLIAMATALGMGAEQIDEFFRQACKR